MIKTRASSSRSEEAVILIAVTNKSTRVIDSEVQLMTRASAKQLRYHLCPAWGLHVPAVLFFKDESLIPPGARKHVVFDNSDAAQALAYHDVGPDGLPYSRTFAATILDNGGTALTGALSVSGAFTHEMCEMAVDALCNLWADNGQRTLVAFESADPVEDQGYDVKVDGTAVTVTDFVLPAWFSVVERGPYDWLQQVSAPFAMTSGGYTIQADESGVKQVWGESYPDWKKEDKAFPAARTARRLGQLNK